MTRLTEEAHCRMAPVLHPGDIAIDATAGNGYDTQFLAETVGESGLVFAFDTQAEAIAQTAARLEQHGLKNVTLLQRNHAELVSAIPDEYRGQVAGVMFNLGYLPGGQKRIVTQTQTTLKAIVAALSLLRSGGLLSLIAYPGHPGGDEEAAAVDDLLRGLPLNEYTSKTIVPPARLNVPPVLHLVGKR